MAMKNKSHADRRGMAKIGKFLGLSSIIITAVEITVSAHSYFDKIFQTQYQTVGTVSDDYTYLHENQDLESSENQYLLQTFSNDSGVEYESVDEMKLLGDYVLYGNWNLYSLDDMSWENFCFTTLNHEGGLKFRVLDFGLKNEGGRWFYILLNNDQYTADCGFVKAYSKYWIYIQNETQVICD